MTVKNLVKIFGDPLFRVIITLTRDELIAIRWGWVRADAEMDVRVALDELNQKSRAESGAGLLLDRVAQNNRALDILVPDEFYGQAEQALK